ncbi:hypothetical protein [Leifsonia sp. AG29]|uniref:hypothetical protein n=1 Tax=Leifsonia sp. AG29 TaxID=2598860 RepID=UPI003FA34D2F
MGDVKEVAWYVLGFAGAVAAVAVGLLFAPDARDAQEGVGGVLAHLTPRELTDLIVALAFGAVAFVSGAYLTSSAATEATASDAEPIGDLIAVESLG